MVQIKGQIFCPPEIWKIWKNAKCKRPTQKMNFKWCRLNIYYEHLKKKMNKFTWWKKNCRLSSWSIDLKCDQFWVRKVQLLFYNFISTMYIQLRIRYFRVCVPLRNVCFTDEDGYVPIVTTIISSCFPQMWLSELYLTPGLYLHLRPVHEVLKSALTRQKPENKCFSNV